MIPHISQRCAITYLNDPYTEPPLVNDLAKDIRNVPFNSIE